MTMLALQDQDAPGTDFAAARRMMVLGQLTPNQVSDPLLLQAMGEVPRELFVPPAARHRAYADEAVPLGSGRAMMTPMAIGRLLQSLQPQPGERALVLGAGTGYGAAILRGWDLEVTAIESDAALLALGAGGAGLRAAGTPAALRRATR
jgi:protein-L-isoaspartate(D-aspartate) O-methyltransferase